MDQGSNEQNRTFGSQMFDLLNDGGSVSGFSVDVTDNGYIIVLRRDSEGNAVFSYEDPSMIFLGSLVTAITNAISGVIAE